MRIECGPVRLSLATGKVKHHTNGSAILDLADKDGRWSGDLYLSPVEMKKLNTRGVRRIETKSEEVGV